MNNTLSRTVLVLVLGLCASSILLFSHLSEEKMETEAAPRPVPNTRYVAQNPDSMINEENHPPMIQAYLNAADEGRKVYLAHYGTLAALHRLPDYPQRSKAQLLVQSPNLFTVRAQRIEDERLRQAIDQTRKGSRPSKNDSPALLYLLLTYDRGQLMENHELLLLSRLLELNRPAVQ